MLNAGLRECLCYSMPPNFLSYCGPKWRGDILEYRKKGIAGQGLSEHILKYHTLYSYLSFIAYENNIQNPFDMRVVKAYWIGNGLLQNFDSQRFYRHLRETLNLKRRLKKKDLESLFGKIPKGALPHHAFHVLNVPWRTGHLPIEHTLETMDSCRIGWGRIEVQPSDLNPQNLIVKYKPLRYENGLLKFGNLIQKQITNTINGSALIKVKAGDWISFHWNTACGKITPEEAFSLNYYTQLAINLANENIRCRKPFGR